jgi:peptidoglycan/xylan/chitin deacetylase (PgdA/CDA1 family)
LLLATAILSVLIGCTQKAEPRWLVRALPGDYPNVVYFVPTEKQAIALTIDDGVDPETTPAILDVLRKHDVRATFFIVSSSIAANSDLVTRMVEEGHELGHHMTEDVVTVSLSDEELTRRFNEAADALEAYAPITWFRAGSGRYNDQVLLLTKERGYRIAMASVAPVDTLIRSPASMARFISWMVEPGSVVVLHDRDDRGRRTVATLERLLPTLKERGYLVTSLSELDGLSNHAALERPDQSKQEAGAEALDQPSAILHDKCLSNGQPEKQRQ